MNAAHGIWKVVNLRTKENKINRLKDAAPTSEKSSSMKVMRETSKVIQKHPQQKDGS